MVKFLSMIFFLDFFNFCWVFQKFLFFVSPCIKIAKIFFERAEDLKYLRTT